jgi:hypothetical protein
MYVHLFHLKKKKTVPPIEQQGLIEREKVDFENNVYREEVTALEG